MAPREVKHWWEKYARNKEIARGCASHIAALCFVILPAAPHLLRFDSGFPFNHMWLFPHDLPRTSPDRVSVGILLYVIQNLDPHIAVSPMRDYTHVVHTFLVSLAQPISGS